VQICADGALYLYNTTRAAQTAAGPTACEAVVLKRAQVPGPETRDCVPVPDTLSFRIQTSDSNYLNGLVLNGENVLTSVVDYSEAEVFKSAPGRYGQITLVSADGRTLYSDQDIGGSGNGPIYFDGIGLLLTSHITPNYFTDRPLKRHLRHFEHEPCTGTSRLLHIKACYLSRC
jgi:hypothetical protein